MRELINYPQLIRSVQVADCQQLYSRETSSKWHQNHSANIRKYAECHQKLVYKVSWSMVLNSLFTHGALILTRSFLSRLPVMRRYEWLIMLTKCSLIFADLKNCLCSLEIRKTGGILQTPDGQRFWKLDLFPSCYTTRDWISNGMTGRPQPPCDRGSSALPLRPNRTMRRLLSQQFYAFGSRSTRLCRKKMALFSLNVSKIMIEKR